MQECVFNTLSANCERRECAVQALCAPWLLNGRCKGALTGSIPQKISGSFANIRSCWHLYALSLCLHCAFTALTMRAMCFPGVHIALMVC